MYLYAWTLQVMFGWRKACTEFSKRLDCDLPFYYHTSQHQHFYEGEMLDFSHASEKKKQNRRELVIRGIGGRFSMVQQGAGSIRTQYHNVPVELPPSQLITTNAKSKN